MQDLIYRQEAIDALEDGKDKKAKGEVGGFYNLIIENDIKKIKDLPSVQPEDIQKIQDLEQAQFYKIYDLAYQEGKTDAMRWISCSDRLPEYGEAVLTINEDGDYEVNHIIDEDNGEWFYEGAIAWMTLPPYKEG